MRKKNLLWWMAAITVCFALVAPAVAHDRDGQQHEGHHEHEGHEHEGHEMSPEEQAMMAAWMHAMTPGEPHAFLARQAGSWTFTGRFWLSPGAEPMESPGTVERTMILGGRVMQERVQSSFMDQPFEGLGLAGYDNVTGEYWSTWTDSMGTGVMTATGACDQAGHCTFAGSYNDPMTGQAKNVRMTLEASEGSEVFRMFEPGPDGDEFMSMELVYTRLE
jgi:hypothetical protein